MYCCSIPPLPAPAPLSAPPPPTLNLSPTGRSTNPTSPPCHLLSPLCSCDSGWTGRSHFLNRHATDPDTCVVSINAITGLTIFALIVSCYGWVISLVRVVEWWRKTRSKVAKQSAQQRPAGGQRSAVSPTDRMTVVSQQLRVVRPHAAPAWSPSHQPQSPTSMGSVASHSNSDSDSSASGLTRSSVGHWLREARDQSFYIPALILYFFSCCVAAFPPTLADPRTVLGQSLLIDFFEVQASCSFALVVCTTVHAILKLASQVRKMNPRDKAMMRNINERLRMACGVAAVVAISVIQLTFIMTTHPELIDVLITIIMLARSAPYWILAVVYLYYSGEVCRTLLHGVETLNEQQQSDRRDVVRKLKTSQYVFACIACSHCIAVFVVALWPLAHNYISYAFYLEWACCAAINIARLNLLRPASSKARSNQIAAAPGVMSTVGASGVKLVMDSARKSKRPAGADSMGDGISAGDGMVAANSHIGVVVEEVADGRGACGSIGDVNLVLVPPTPRGVQGESINAEPHASGLLQAAAHASVDGIPGNVELTV